MKILRLTTLLDFGGQEKQYISFTDNPELLQKEYVFAAIGHGGHAEQVLRKRGFEVHILNRNYSIRNLSNIIALYRLIRKVKPDIVHTAAAEANLQGIIAAKLAGVKTIIGEEIGLPNNHSHLARIIFKIIYSFASHIIAVSQKVKSTLIEIGEAKESKIEIIYNPVSAPIEYESKEHKDFNWVFVSRLIPRKNTITLIEAFSRLPIDRRGVLTIVGDGPERKFLESRVAELSLEKSVYFKGFQPEPEIFINEADVFVLPAFDEGFGIVVIEAMLQKKACLCGFGGGIPEYLIDNLNGWFFNPYSVEDLCEKMEEILSKDKKEIISIGEKAFEMANEKFSVSRYIENIENFYQSIYDRKK
ncbi:glycosyltransferase family 4 protein [Weeksellaceae bacterium A-14]